MSILRPDIGWSYERVTSHPGEILREEFLAPLNWDAAELARRLAVPAAELQSVMKEERPVSPELAIRLGRCFNMSAQFWLNLQSLHDLTAAQQAVGARVEQEVKPMPLSVAA